MKLTKYLGITSVLLASGAAQAVLIDDFSNGGTSPTAASSPPGYGLVFDEVSSTSAIGGAHAAYMERTGTTLTASNASVSARICTSCSDFKSAQDSGQLGYTGVRWDGAADNTLSTAGLGGVDLTGGGVSNAFELGIVYVDIDDVADVTLEVWSGANSASATLTDINDNSDAGRIYSLLFSSFVGGAIDWTSIDAIDMRVDNQAVGEQSVDLDIGFLRTNVPLPPTVLLLMIGAAALARRLRKTEDPVIFA